MVKPYKQFYKSLFNILTPYFQKRLLFVLTLGFVSGLPLLLSFGTLSAWLREAEIERSTIGLFSLLSLEINLSIVAAVLTIVGYSMNDTVVIYDRIRENLIKYSSLKIGEISNKSINETLSRTIITSSTTLLALISIFILGGEILKGFSLAMIIGVIIGTYSSIFVASPILKYFNVSFKTISKEKENN